MDMYDIAAGAKLAHDHAFDMEDKVNTVRDLVRTLSVFGRLLKDAEDQSAFQRVVHMVQDANEELEQVRSEIADATDLDRIQSPLAFAVRRMRAGDKKGTGVWFHDNGDVVIEWQHGDGRRTGTRFTKSDEFERDSRGGIVPKIDAA